MIGKVSCHCCIRVCTRVFAPLCWHGGWAGPDLRPFSSFFFRTHSMARFFRGPSVVTRSPPLLFYPPSCCWLPWVFRHKKLHTNIYATMFAASLLPVVLFPYAFYRECMHRGSDLPPLADFRGFAYSRSRVLRGGGRDETKKQKKTSLPGIEPGSSLCLGGR